MDIEELKVYQLSMDIAEKIWNLVIKWDHFAKDTIGKQLIRSSDSVAANLSVRLNNYIKSIGRTSGKQVNEDDTDFLDY